MKKERYFRDELRKLFMTYAIIPAVVFTIISVIILMLALLYGKRNSGIKQAEYVSSEVERVLDGYKEELEQLAQWYSVLDDNLNADNRIQVFENFYQVSNEVGYAAEIYIMDKHYQIVLSNKMDVPDFLVSNLDVSWGLMGSMDENPGETVFRLIDPWKSSGAGIALGMACSKNNNIVGYVVFVINRSSLHQAIDRTDIQTIITDRFGWVYTTNNNNFITNSNHIVYDLENRDGFFSSDREIHVVYQLDVYDSMFKVYTVSDIQNIIYSLSISGTLIITALIIMTIWVLISSKKVTEKKTLDFYTVLDVMEKAQNGNLELMIEIESDNEFRFIADAYNETIISLKRQMENNKRMTELVAASQRRQLELQFNPHFLYNTLENIRYMCIIEPKIAQKMIYSLSNLLRYSMATSREEVPIHEDLQHLNSYITILKYRFNRRFCYEIDMEQKCLSCMIPKLVFQPMIENAVKYGFGGRETLKVELKVYQHDGNLVMICHDNGVGITEEKLSELNHILEQEEHDGRHSGLYNIHRRIQILYGNLYGVEVRSNEGYGTTLIVNLPIHEEEIEC